MAGKVRNLRNMRFGRLIATKHIGFNGKNALWLCRCDCGKTKRVVVGSLTGNRTKSCGCLPPGSKSRHGENLQSGPSPTYSSWSCMIQRCLNPNNTGYSGYGGRGITVCDRWNPRAGGSFENFRDDLGHRPQGTTL